MASSGSNSSTPPTIQKKNLDLIYRNALRYTISAKEYQIVYKYLLSRSPPVVKQHAPAPAKYPTARSPNDDYTAAAIRASLRVFIASQAGLTVWDFCKTRLLSKGRSRRFKLKSAFFWSPNFRLSLSLSTLLLLHRLLFRFFTILRQNLLHHSADPFRQRNPRIARSLTSRLAPAIGASLSGFALALYPADQFRFTVTIDILSRAAEVMYNNLAREGWFAGLRKRGWVGSWMLMPLATGQLLHAFVFDRDCYPKSYGDFILKHSPAYIHPRPETHPAHLPWPDSSTVVDALAEMARLHWPPFTSPILFPTLPTTLPPTLSNPPLASISALTSPASPSHTHLSCALLHPSNPSCLSTYTSFHTQAFPPLFRFFLLVFSALNIPFRFKAFFSNPTTQSLSIIRKALRMAFFVTTAVGSSWASICFFATYLPRSMIPKARFFWGGFLGGLFAFVFHGHGEARGTVMASVRASMDSFWKVGVKRGWWRGIKGGDVFLLVVSLAIINGVYERDDGAVDGMVKQGVRFLRGEDGREKKLGGEKKGGMAEEEEEMSEG